MASAKLMDIVMVHWVDSCEPQPNSEIEPQDIPGVQDIIQVGYLVKKTKDSISVAGAWKQELKTYFLLIKASGGHGSRCGRLPATTQHRLL